MFHLYYDPTEARADTRLPQSVIASGEALDNLERMTGADLLLTRREINALTPGSLPSEMRLRVACEDGLLVQRKSGLDLANSLADLPFILVRMLAWTNMPFLLYTGAFEFDSDDLLIVNGRSTKWGLPLFVGSLEWWQLRGGYVVHLGRDDEIPAWIRMWDRRFDGLQQAKVKELVARPIKQRLIAADWKDTLAALPNIGSDRARALGAEFDTLAEALVWLASELPSKRVPGVGNGVRGGVRKYFGLRPGEQLKIDINQQLETEETEP